MVEGWEERGVEERMMASSGEDQPEAGDDGDRGPSRGCLWSEARGESSRTGVAHWTLHHSVMSFHCDQFDHYIC